MRELRGDAVRPSALARLRRLMSRTAVVLVRSGYITHSSSGESKWRAFACTHGTVTSRSCTHAASSTCRCGGVTTE